MSGTDSPRRRDPAPLALALALTLALSTGCRERGYHFEDLGIPRTARTPQARAVLGGALLVTLFETKGESRLAVVDLATAGQDEVPLPGATGADAIAVDAGRDVAYIGTSTRAGLYRFEGRTRQASRVDALDPFLADERYVWALAVGRGGEVFAGTYPGGRLLAYDPRTGRARTLGSPLPGRQYVRDILIGPSGTVYCGLGTPAAIAAVDPITGRSRVLVSAAAGDAAFPSTLRIRDGYLTADIGATEFRAAAREREPAVRVETPQIAIDPDGRYVVRAKGGEHTGRLELSARQDGMGIMGLAAGPDGGIYGATYYNASLFRLDPGRGLFESLGRVENAVGEFRVMQPISPRRLLLPGYGGTLFVYDLDRPWGVTGAGANPWRLGEIGQGQHLALALDWDGRHVAIATPPGYGLRGGALTVLDSESLTWRTFAHLVPDQSFTAVCFGRGGALYGGTSVEVGPGETVRARSAHLVVLDARTGAVHNDLVPIPEASAITALVGLDGGRILGGTDRGDLFVLGAGETAVKIVARLPHIRQLWWWGQERAVLGIGWRRGLFRVHPGSLKVDWIPGAPERLVPGMAADKAGRVYLHDGIRVFRMGRR